MIRSSLLQRRVVIVDDSRTVQAILDNAFSKRSDFRVVGFAHDASSAVEMIRRLLPEIVTIDLCMPYIDGAALLEMIRDLPHICKIVVSEKSLSNLLLTAKLIEAGASACIPKKLIVDNPDSFFKSINDAVRKTAGKGHYLSSIGQASAAPKAISADLFAKASVGFPVPYDENDRIAFIKRSGLANAKRERPFDLITKHIATATAFPACLLTVIDRDTQWIKSAYGMDVESTPRDQAFCNYTIAQGGAFVVSNAASDERFANNLLVKGLPNIRSYAGHPVVNQDGVAIAALCVIDMRVRTVSQHVIEQLAGMSAVIAAMIDQRVAVAA